MHVMPCSGHFRNLKIYYEKIFPDILQSTISDVSLICPPYMYYITFETKKLLYFSRPPPTMTLVKKLLTSQLRKL